jgi:hypothetical protein
MLGEAARLAVLGVAIGIALSLVITRLFVDSPFRS